MSLAALAHTSEPASQSPATETADVTTPPAGRPFAPWVVAAAAVLPAACDSATEMAAAPVIEAPSPTTPSPAASPANDAARFLTQASFGPTPLSVEYVKAVGLNAWLSDQTAIAPTDSHLAYLDARLTQLRATNPGATLNATHFYESFWAEAAGATDQLRQRVKFALSEIFVISLADAAIEVRGAASYYDMLGANAFGNYRTLLEQVSLHPMMGVYLTHVANQKADAATGRRPDENYAREVLQLMSIGVSQLNTDGTVKTDGTGAPIPSYTATDIAELAKVFTGLSWYHPTPTANTFLGRGTKDPAANIRPMIAYPAYHSTEQKAFLGTTIATGSTDAMADLRIALDAIFNHPNVPPFIAKLLIQRLVTSNPTPAYVARVAAAFAGQNGSARGDLGVTVRAVLTDVEARDYAAALASPSFGKLREPMVRLANWMRAFSAVSVSGNWLVGSTSAQTSLGQSPLTSPSVFNFYRPGYSPPNTRAGAAGMVAPEFQVVDEVSVVGFLNTMQTAINGGIGTGSDVRAGYFAEIAVAGDAAALVERMNLLLVAGRMSPTLRGKIVDAVNGVTIPAATPTNQAQRDAALLNRSKLAIFLTMASPEFMMQR